jgi:hypothetical protein
MKIGFISIFRTFHLNPPSGSHSPDSPDSLIFSHQKPGSVRKRGRAVREQGTGAFPVHEPSITKTSGPTRKCRVFWFRLLPAFRRQGIEPAYAVKSAEIGIGGVDDRAKSKSDDSDLCVGGEIAGGANFTQESQSQINVGPV